MLAPSRVSAALINAKSPHDAIIDEPPFDTNGNVTPVSGSRSTEPQTFKITCVTIAAVAAQAAMT